MNKKKKKLIRNFSIIGIILAVVIAAFISGNRTADAKQFYIENKDKMAFSTFKQDEENLHNNLLSYGKVLTKYEKKDYKPYAGEDIVIPADSYTNKDNTGSKVVPFEGSYQGPTNMKEEEKQFFTPIPARAGSVIVNGEGISKLDYTLEVPESGLYQFDVSYLLFSGKDTPMAYGVTVDEKKPFEEANYLSLTRKYSFYKTDKFDAQDNQIRPSQREVFQWQTRAAQHPEGFYRNPYSIYLDKGTRKISFEFSREAGAIEKITFRKPIINMDYSEYIANHKNDAKYSGDTKLIQMEVPESKSELGMRMEWEADYSSIPASYDNLRYNTFGGDRWKLGGQSANWTFDVPEDGMYKLAFRYAIPSSYTVCYRQIAIDNNIPFKEMEEYAFPFVDGWVGDSVKDSDNQPYLFYLTKGSHEIKITSKLGSLRHSIQVLNDLDNNISKFVRTVLQITASQKTAVGTFTIDNNRNWDLDIYIPTIKEDLKTYKEALNNQYNYITECNGGNTPYYASSLIIGSTLFGKMLDDLETIPSQINEINNTLNGLATTVSAMKEQPLIFDYMMLAKPDATFTDARSNSIQKLYVGIKQFYLSFVKDYSSIGSTPSDKPLPEVSIWVARGREWVEILRDMINDQFTPKEEIKIKLNTIPGSTDYLLLLSYTAGKAPDGAISVGGAVPVDFAARGAVYPLDKLPGIDELKKQYVDAAFVPYEYKDNLYAFPETQNYSLLFYRTDILDELGLTPPDTWNDVYKMLPILQESGLDFFYGFDVGGYTPFLWQNGGDFYMEKDSEGYIKSALDTPQAYNAFKEFGNLFINFKLQYKADFYQRIRTGEMPIGVGSYDLYVKLMTAAPELKGKWKMIPLPGHLNKETNQVERWSGGNASCVVIMNPTKITEETTKQVGDTWKFMSWWLEKQTQTEYGKQIEATFGAGSRWNTANKESLMMMPYTTSEIQSILEQWKWYKEAPNVLGGYYTGRYLLTALNDAVITGENARISLDDAVKEINKELYRKQSEINNLKINNK